MFVTFDVSNRGIVVKAPQLKNILLMFVTPMLPLKSTDIISM